MRRGENVVWGSLGCRGLAQGFQSSAMCQDWTELCNVLRPSHPTRYRPQPARPAQPAPTGVLCHLQGWPPVHTGIPAHIPPFLTTLLRELPDPTPPFMGFYNTRPHVEISWFICLLDWKLSAVGTRPDLSWAPACKRHSVNVCWLNE